MNNEEIITMPERDTFVDEVLTKVKTTAAYASSSDKDTYLAGARMATIFAWDTIQEISAQSEYVQEQNKNSFKDAIRERAKQIDPWCWESYSGQPKDIRSAKDHRRNASRAQAEAELRSENEHWRNRERM